MIDLILRASTKADLRTWAKDNSLMIYDGEEWHPRDGLEWSWWGGSGKLMTDQGTVDVDGNQITAPAFASGVVALMRLHSDFFASDKLEPDEDNPDAAEQWARSKVVRYIKNNGTPGTTAGISYYELDGVRVYRPQDVVAFCESRGVPGHSFS